MISSEMFWPYSFHFFFVFTFIFPQRKNLGTGEKHKYWSKSSIWFKKKKSVFRLILEGNLLAQLQKVDKDLMYLLLFLKVYAHVLYWIIIGQEWGSVLFFPISYEMISNELVIIVSGSKYKMKVKTMLKCLSHSKVELLYLFKRHTSDFLIQAFWRNLGLTPSFRNKLEYLFLFLFAFCIQMVVLLKEFFFLNRSLCISVSAFLSHHLLLFFPPCK